MSVINTAWDLQQGKTADHSLWDAAYQPIQMLPREEKDDQWKMRNMNWWEQIGLKHIQSNSQRYLKNYRLAEGLVDRSDYIVDEGNEYKDIIHNLTDSDKDSALSIEFFPIIPNVVGVMLGEFSKRTNKILIRAIDKYSTNERIEKLQAELGNRLLLKLQNDMINNLKAQGVDISSDEGAQEVQKQLESTKDLPEISNYYRKGFRGVVEQWASNHLNEADELYRMYEMENDAFKDYLVTKNEFWHVKLGKEKYDLELWSPLNTFFHTSPDVKYVSEGNYVGRMIMMSIPDVIDRYGNKMKEKQIKSLETHYLNHARVMAMGGDNTQYYDTSKPMSMQYPNSVNYEKVMAFQKSFIDDTLASPNFYDILKTTSSSVSQEGMVRVTEVYWRSMRKVGELYKVEIDGKLTKKIVDETYEVIEEPVYDETLKKGKTHENLIFGEHIDWTWAPEVWRGVKIGSGYSSGVLNSQDFPSLYIDVEPLPFQFKGSQNIYDAKLPVEGPNFSTRTGKNRSFVDMMKPFQIIFNLSANQAKDMLIDELGTVILIDQNALPKHSMGEEWGRGNVAKAYRAMKDWSVLPLDTSLMNTEVPTNFQHFQSVDLSQTNRIMSRIQICNWAKNECFASVGITPERLGTVMASQSATGTTQAVNNSYAQTEMWFVEHSNFIMPRVKEMMLNAAQYYNASQEEIQVVSKNSRDEDEYFTMVGTELLPRDLKVFDSARPDQKAILDQIKQLALNNNTSGATIFDLAKILESDSVNEILSTLRTSVDTLQQQQQAQIDQQSQVQQQMIEAQAEEKQKEREFEATENQLDREARLAEAQMKALGTSLVKDSDTDNNSVPDVLEASKFSETVRQFEEDMVFRGREHSLKEQKLVDDRTMAQKKLDFEKEKLDSQMEMKRLDLLNPTSGEKKPTKKK